MSLVNRQEFLDLAKRYDVDLFVGGFSSPYANPQILDQEIRYELDRAAHAPACPPQGCKVLAIAGGTFDGIGAIYNMKNLPANMAGLVSTRALKHPEDMPPAVPTLVIERPITDWSLGGENIALAKELQAAGKGVEAVYLNGGPLSAWEIREYADNAIPVRINNHPQLNHAFPNAVTLDKIWSKNVAPLDVKKGITIGSSLDARPSLGLAKVHETTGKEKASGSEGFVH